MVTRKGCGCTGEVLDVKDGQAFVRWADGTVSHIDVEELDGLE